VCKDYTQRKYGKRGNCDVASLTEDHEIHTKITTAIVVIIRPGVVTIRVIVVIVRAGVFIRNPYRQEQYHVVTFVECAPLAWKLHHRPEVHAIVGFVSCQQLASLYWLCAC
jgi:UDP-N-acetylglucosamine:LPS N-acetylglucosamine transferase